MNALLPSELAVANARLPQAYEAARTALSNCASIDECQAWADKAEALASYAKQSNDNSLRLLADRIQARAVRRCGELLKQFDGRGNNQHTEGKEGTLLTQRTAADAAGISEHQRKTAVRVANVPEAAFEAAA